MAKYFHENWKISSNVKFSKYKNQWPFVLVNFWKLFCDPQVCAKKFEPCEMVPWNC
jgi:hypothetical protein